MSSDISYTTEEIAALLKVSKLTVYDLIKKGELPAYRVGKQMRIDDSDLQDYKRRSKQRTAAAGAAEPSAQGGGPSADQPGARTSPEAAPDTAVPSARLQADRPAAIWTAARSGSPASGSADDAPERGDVNAAGNAGTVRPVVITGQDVSLDLLAAHLGQAGPGIRPLRAYVGSLDSLISMYQGSSDIVSVHLLDGDTGEYNLPYIRKLLPGFSYLVVNLLSRKAGLYTATGNPLQLRDWSDLGRPGLRLINRERGSGARVLLDEQLRLHSIKPSSIAGYDNEERNHLGVAAKVAAGEADAGVGIEKAASIVSNVSFVPLIDERYDLVMLKKPGNLEWIAAVLRILRSDAFRSELGGIPGYDLSMTGQILFEC